MKTLILTEKPSVASDFAKALGIRGRQNGYMENQQYVITWAIGHLVELFEPQDYNPAWKRWSFDNLPIIPESYNYKPIKKTAAQLGIIRRLLSGPGIGRVIIATDAGREGEVIARTVLLAAAPGRRFELFRFWTSQALTPGVIKAAMGRLKPASAYDRLWEAGRVRQVADWLVGMNGSRAATIKMKDLFSVGRVQTAVLALLVERFKTRRDFKPEPYFLIRGDFANIKGRWQGLWTRDGKSRVLDRKQAGEILERVSGAPGVVESVKKQKKQQPPPLLYSLTDLQRDANIRFGFSAKKTLEVAQNLYEKRKCLSYPRTDSRVLGSQNVGLAQGVIGKLSPVYPEAFSGVDHTRVSQANRRVFNDAALTDHHGLIPTAKLPESAGADEKKIYDLVLNRFAAAFYPDCVFLQTEIITRVARDDLFVTKGKVILEPGWQKLLSQGKGKKKKEEENPEQENLPDLEKGDPAEVKKVGAEEKMTTPPPEYSEALLLKDMTNPGRYVEEAMLKKIYRGDVGLGTQATRAQIIETLLSRKYLVREKKHLKATEKGVLLIETLKKLKVSSMIASPEETARWEMMLSDISMGSGSQDSFLKEIENLVKTMIQEFRDSDVAEYASKTEVLGRCPSCGGDVVEEFKTFACVNHKKGGCGFSIWKTVAGKKLSPGALGWILSGKTAGPFKGFKSRKGKRFSASLKLVFQEEKWALSFVFDNPKEGGVTGAGVGSPVKSLSAETGGASVKPASGLDKPEDMGRCPMCGGIIIRGKKGFGCSNWRACDGGCRFVIWQVIMGKKLTPANIKTLVSGKTTRQYVFRKDGGGKFKAKLVLKKLPGGGFETTLVDVTL